MQSVTISQIEERLKNLPPEKLAVVYDFVSYLMDREVRRAAMETPSEGYQTMLASQSVLQRDWDRPEEDVAWANL
jgi:hypothetical protein